MHKALVIGLGAIGMEYDYYLDNNFIYTHSKAIYYNDDFELVGGVDVDYEKRVSFSNKYNVKSFIDIEIAIKETLPDLIVLSLPTIYHLKVIKEITRICSPLVILCEKPLGYTLTESIEIKEIIDKKKIKLFVNYFRRSDPGIEKVKQIISQNCSSQIKGVVWYTKGLKHNGSHFFNLFEYWFGELIDFKVVSNKKNYRGTDPEPDVYLTYKNAEIFFSSAWEDSFSYYDIELLGNFGKIIYNMHGEILYFNIVDDELFNGYKILNKTPSFITHNNNKYQEDVYNNISLYLKNKKYNLCSLEQAITTNLNIDKIIKNLNNEK